MDHGDAAEETGKPLPQLIAIVIGRRLLDPAPDLAGAGGEGGGIAAAAADGGRVLVDDRARRLTEIPETGVLEAASGLGAHHLAAGEDREIREQGFLAIAEAGRLDRRRLERAPELVDDEDGEGLPFHVFGDDEERAPQPRHLIEEGQELPEAREPAIVEEEERPLERHLHALGIGDEVRREIPAVELHSLDDRERGPGGPRLLDHDHPVPADLGHGPRDELPDLPVVAGREGGDLSDPVRSLDGCRARREVGDHDRHRPVDPALHGHRMGSRRHVAEPVVEEGLREHGRGGRAVARDFLRPGRHVLDELRAHVLERIGRLDLARHGDPVAGQGRHAEPALENDAPPARTEGDPDGVRDLVDAAAERIPRGGVEAELLGHRSPSRRSGGPPAARARRR